MKIALIMPPSKEAQRSFSYAQLALKELFSLHEVQGWILDWDNENGRAIPWLGKPENLICRSRGKDLLFPQQALFWLEQMCRAENPDLIFVYGNIFGRQLTGLLAEKLGWGCFSDMVRLENCEKIYAYKKVCSSNALWKREIGGSQLLSIAEGGVEITGEFEFFTPTEKSYDGLDESINFESKFLEKSDQNPLEKAKRVLIGGRGLGSIEGADKLHRLAKIMGAEVAFSRPAAMNGWGSIDRVVGQSGLRIAPELCLAFGVSGSAAFLSGVEQAGELVAINTDPDAPIFKAADKGIIGDANEVIDHLLALALEKTQAENI